MSISATNIIVEFFALVVTAILLFCTYFDSVQRNRLSLMMKLIMIGNMGLLLSCIATWVLEGNSEYEALNTVFTSFANGLGFPMAAFYTEYVSCSIGKHTAEPRRFAHIVEGICILAFALNFVSIFNGMYFSCSGGVYTRGPLFMLNQGFSAVILIPNIIIILKNYRQLERREALALLSFPIVPLVVAMIQFAVFGITIMCLATTITVIIIYVAAFLQRGQKLDKQKKELTESRISIMLSQIQPHFLCNSLNAIYYLCKVDADKAQKALDEFATYLRINLDSLKQSQPVSFNKELEHIKIYLSLEKLCFEEELQIVYDLQASGFMLPALTVQPLVENAVKYGIGQKPGGGTVTIATRETEAAFEVCISDDGIGYDVNQVQKDGRTHIGIDNVRQRLSTMCHGRLTIESKTNKGTTATIIIPKEGT